MKASIQTKKLMKKLAYLEFVNDQLSSHKNALDQMLRLVGFANGMDTIKEIAEDLLQNEELDRIEPKYEPSCED